MTNAVFDEEELVRLTSYKQPAKQLAELHRRGFHRAYLNRLNRVTLERAHFDAVCRGATEKARAKVRMLSTA